MNAKQRNKSKRKAAAQQRKLEKQLIDYQTAPVSRLTLNLVPKWTKPGEIVLLETLVFGEDILEKVEK